MRRTAFAALALVFLLLAGCSKVIVHELKPEDITFTFACKADITSDGKKMECTVSRSAPGIITIGVVSGGVSGLTYFWDSENFSVSYLGLAADSEECVLPKTSFAYLIKQTLDSASSTGALTKTHGNEFSGTASGYNYLITADVNTGLIQTLSIPKYNLIASFHDFSEPGT